MWSICFLGKGGLSIFSKFFAIEPEKQSRILNAAIREFASKGFVQASTNEIVKEAGISKGILFHYFNNKRDLYLFVYNYAMDMLIREYLEKIDLAERDIFQRLRHAVLIKYALLEKVPDMFDFIKSAYFEEAAEVRSDLVHKNKEVIAGVYDKTLQGLDVSRFRKDLEVEKAIRMILWTLEGLSAAYQDQMKNQSLRTMDFGPILAEVDEYLGMLKKCMYEQ